MPDNPYESTEQPHGKKPPRSAMGQLGRLLLYSAVIAVLVALLLPATRSARGPAMRVQCVNNMKQIMLGILSYEADHGELPPAYTVDASGNRLHSWRTLILPYMDASDVYEKIDLTKPWDDPANAAAREAIIPAYNCPSAAMTEDYTTYVAVVGSEFLFTGSTPRKMEEAVDDASNTIAVLEVSLKHAVPWMSPEDVDEKTLLNAERALSSGHNRVVVGYLDGSVEAIDVDIDRNELRKMLTIAGREAIGEDE
ncbi:DUF1559 domain-containing protein [Aeoliella sp.]|uniref:DUF1559 family PulG-like putative transporter n=1 Tax=Aeoliella sp. TaxID=2795800 RepID=UPI003CCC407E